MKEAFLPPRVNVTTPHFVEINVVILEQIAKEFGFSREALKDCTLNFSPEIEGISNRLGLFTHRTKSIQIAVDHIISDVIKTFECQKMEGLVYHDKYGGAGVRSTKLKKYLEFIGKHPEHSNRAKLFLAKLTNRSINRFASIILFHELFHHHQYISNPIRFESLPIIVNFLYLLDEATSFEHGFIRNLIKKYDKLEAEAIQAHLNFLRNYPEFHELVKIKIPKLA